MARNEAQTRFELIDPALHERGWMAQYIKVEENAGGIETIDGITRRRQKRADYVLRLQITSETQPVAVTLIEAKAEDKSPSFGLEQGKRYADCDRLNVNYIFSTNGRQFVEFDKLSGETSAPKPMDEFPAIHRSKRPLFFASVIFTLNLSQTK
ncbi:MAG: type I restriction enzyme HsdR N-terminal domain-containing protein [Spirochaetaceae bacterium]|jgi:type I restriction enzyme R subunit|nr:type I restriction enzyme HsdR N-terminal domain-containing protein [Spirochaetaceae bacterium]